jgi:hypothetical protein
MIDPLRDREIILLMIWTFLLLCSSTKRTVDKFPVVKLSDETCFVDVDVGRRPAAADSDSEDEVSSSHPSHFIRVRGKAFCHGRSDFRRFFSVTVLSGRSLMARKAGPGLQVFKPPP